jgi:hypothetical protein
MPSSPSESFLPVPADLGSSSEDYFSISEWKFASGLVLVLRPVEEAADELYPVLARILLCYGSESVFESYSINSEERNGFSANSYPELKKSSSHFILLYAE